MTELGRPVHVNLDNSLFLFSMAGSSVVQVPFIYSCSGDDTRHRTAAIFMAQKRTKKKRAREEIKVVTRGWNFQLVLAILYLLFNLALFKEQARRQFILISRPTGYILFLLLMFSFNGWLNFYFDLTRYYEDNIRAT